MNYIKPEVLIFDENDIKIIEAAAKSCNCHTGKSTHSKFKRDKKRIVKSIVK